MIKIQTRPINTRPKSSMRAALNSQYCMRAQLRAKGHLGWCAKHSSEVEELANGFTYQEGQHHVRRGQHRVISDKEKSNGRSMPEEIKVSKTKNGKRWNTSAMEVELAKDILEVRDGLGKIVDALILHPK